MTKLMDELADVATEALSRSGHLSTTRGRARKVIEAILPVLAQRMLESPVNDYVYGGTPISAKQAIDLIFAHDLHVQISPFAPGTTNR